MATFSSKHWWLLVATAAIGKLEEAACVEIKK